MSPANTRLTYGSASVCVTTGSANRIHLVSNEDSSIFFALASWSGPKSIPLCSIFTCFVPWLNALSTSVIVIAGPNLSCCESYLSLHEYWFTTVLVDIATVGVSYGIALVLSPSVSVHPSTPGEWSTGRSLSFPLRQQSKYPNNLHSRCISSSQEIGLSIEYNFLWPRPAPHASAYLSACLND